MMTNGVCKALGLKPGIQAQQKITTMTMTILPCDVKETNNVSVHQLTLLKIVYAHQTNYIRKYIYW